MFKFTRRRSPFLSHAANVQLFVFDSRPLGFKSYEQNFNKKNILEASEATVTLVYRSQMLTLVIFTIAIH